MPRVICSFIAQSVVAKVSSILIVLLTHAQSKKRKDLKNNSRLKNEVQNGNIVFNIFVHLIEYPLLKSYEC